TDTDKLSFKSWQVRAGNNRKVLRSRSACRNKTNCIRTLSASASFWKPASSADICHPWLRILPPRERSQMNSAPQANSLPPHLTAKRQWTSSRVDDLPGVGFSVHDLSTFSRPAIDENVALLHHYLDALALLQNTDIGQRITIHGDDVGELAL